MKDYVKYNSDGKILSYGSCLDSDLSLQELRDGEFILEASYAPNKKVQDGVLVDATPDTEELNAEAMKELRAIRNKILQNTDWTQLTNSPLSDSQKTKWNTYRQSLRDLPASNKDITDIEDVTWPTPPS